jgi:hypothetical protein
MSEAHISPARLKSERNWTEKLIRDFLGEPDKLVKNPHHRTGPMMRLYSIERVDLAEAEPAFLEYVERKAAQRDRQSKTSKATNEAKRHELFTAISAIELSIPAISDSDLWKKAVEHYNALWASRGKFEKGATLDWPPDQLNRIAVNMLRHWCDEYEPVLVQLFGLVGKHEAYHLLKCRCLQEIGVRYPSLHPECQRQLGG